METSDKIIVPISKAKLTLLLIISIIFTVLGLIYSIYPKALKSILFNNEFIIILIGISCFLFFGFGSFYIFKKLFDNNPGLIISSEGIFDNSSATPVGLIEWNDIMRADTTKVFGQRMILIKVKNPTKYINRQNSKRAKNVLKANNNFYGTPIAITSNGLKINFERLLNIITEQIDKNRK